MSSQPSEDFSEEAGRRDYKAPHSGKHQIPTIQKYREHRSEIDEREKEAEDAQHSEEDDSKTKRAFESVKSIFKEGDKDTAPGNAYPTSNRNANQTQREPEQRDSTLPTAPSADDLQDDSNKNHEDPKPKQGDSIASKGLSATEKAASTVDPRQKRKEMKKNKRDEGGRVSSCPLVFPLTNKIRLSQILSHIFR